MATTSKQASTNVASGSWAHSINLTEAHALLAKICIKYLSLEGFATTKELNQLDVGHSVSKDQEDFDLEEDGDEDDDDDYDYDNDYDDDWEFDKEFKKKLLDRYHFLEYAASHWETHFMEGGYDQRKPDTDNTLALYNDQTENLSTWTKISDKHFSWFTDCIPRQLRRGILLIVATVMRSQIIFKSLLEGTNLESDPELAEATLLMAIRSREEDKAIILLQSGVNPNCQDTSGETAIFSSISSLLKTVIEWLLEHNVRIDVKALYDVAVASDIQLLQALLARKPDVNVVDSEGYAPLHRATMRGEDESIELLLRSGADNKLLTTDEPSTTLHLAARQSSAEAVRKLLKCGIDINVQDYHGNTALQIASLSWKLTCCRIASRTPRRFGHCGWRR